MFGITLVTAQQHACIGDNLRYPFFDIRKGLIAVFFRLPGAQQV
jgi:hypothetical protein